MSDYVVETTSSNQLWMPILKFSLIMAIGFVFFFLYAKRQPQNSNKENKVENEGDKSNKKSEILVDVEVPANKQDSCKDSSTEVPSHDTKLHLFNRKIKEEYSKKEEFDPFGIITEMQKENIHPDITTYNTLLGLCFARNKIDLAAALFAKLES